MARKKKKEKDKKDEGGFVKITLNRKAYHNYEIIDKFEAGMVLVGSEVKSIREGKVNLKDGYVLIRLGEAFLINAHISQYSNASYNNHEPERERKLLLNKRELMKLDKKVKTRGVAIIPLRMYFNPKGRIKIEIALAKGKRDYDKKQAIRDKDIKRDTDREMKDYR
ncbi:MAG: SsrA-binding protein SmpB [bacterium]|nr:SsrA-binding protein SmpB [bacterium]